MAPGVKQEAYGSVEAFPAGLSRVERVDWGSDYGRLNRRTLGDLRRLLRELADWSDEAIIECAGVSAFRSLPLHTEDQT